MPKRSVEAIIFVIQSELCEVGKSSSKSCGIFILSVFKDWIVGCEQVAAGTKAYLFCHSANILTDETDHDRCRDHEKQHKQMNDPVSNQ